MYHDRLDCFSLQRCIERFLNRDAQNNRLLYYDPLDAMANNFAVKIALDVEYIWKFRHPFIESAC
jgi:hypothetical protein